METYEANRIALGDSAKAVSDALKKLGMRQCSSRLVYYQSEPRELRLDWYGAFWRWCHALWMVNRAGAEFLFEDFLARVERLRRGNVPAGDWYEMVARCEEAHSDVISVAIRNNDMRLLVKELAEDIATKRELLLMAQSRISATKAVPEAA